MYLAYSLLLTLGLLVLIPHFLYQVLAHGKYIDGLRQRLGSLQQIPKFSQPVIWLHCVSVGETQAARPLVKRLRDELPEHALVISTITATGQKLAQQVFANDAAAIFYFPFDWRWTVRRALRKVNPHVVLILETELWPNFLRECRKQQIPVGLVNGRISRQSFRRYRLIRFFLRKVLADLNLAVMQTEGDADRIADLGLSRDKLFFSGNLKFDVGSSSVDLSATEAIKSRFGIQPETLLLLAASTHGPEEKIMLESYQHLQKQFNLRLIIAPRKPERFQEVANLIESSGLTWTRRTSSAQPSDASVDVILLDTIGELPATYPLAAIVFVGGSIVDRGGHNVLEPAAAGACVITGHNTDNFQVIVQLLNEAHAIVQLPPLEIRKAADCLTHELKELLTDNERRIELGERAQKLVEDNQGAADRTMDIIRPLVNRSSVEKSEQITLLAKDIPNT